MEWWSLVAGYCSNSQRKDRENLQSHWRSLWRMAETEEETSMRNHLKRARLKIKGDGRKVPKEVVIEDKCLTFILFVANRQSSYLSEKMDRNLWRTAG